MRLTGILGPAAAAGAVLVVVRRRYLIANVQGISMRPTFEAGTRLLVRRCGADGLRRGGVVVLGPPRDAMTRTGADLAVTRMVKRVVALPGDTVPRDEFPALRDAEGATIPPGCLVVAGDNRGRSLDSRQLGYFRTEAVVGVPVRTLFPDRSPVDVRAVTTAARGRWT